MRDPEPSTAKGAEAPQMELQALVKEWEAEAAKGTWHPLISNTYLACSAQLERALAPSDPKGTEQKLEEPGAERANTVPIPMERHVGFFAYRLHPDADNPREVSFAEQWREENKFGQLQHLIPNLTKRDEQVAATIIQWLGSNIGMAFLRDVVKRDAQVREWLER